MISYHECLETRPSITAAHQMDHLSLQVLFGCCIKGRFDYIPNSWLIHLVGRERYREMVKNMLKSVKDWCLYDPRRIVRITVLIVCFFVVLVQASLCSFLDISNY